MKRIDFIFAIKEDINGNKVLVKEPISRGLSLLLTAISNETKEDD